MQKWERKGVQGKEKNSGIGTEEGKQGLKPIRSKDYIKGYT